VWAGDPEQSTFDIAAMDTRVADSIWQRRMSGALILTFAGLALVLAAVGIYGVMSHAVGQRTRELGIRFAMGATSRDVLKLVLSDGVKLIGLGIGLGLLGAFIISRIIRGLLYGVSSTDPLTFVLVPFFLFTVAIMACLIPALRATRVDPLVALRNE
jgi:ABC-type antimicrobial peptide transport system permease subunit